MIIEDILVAVVIGKKYKLLDMSQK